MNKILIDEATVKLAMEVLENSPMSRKNKDGIDALREALAKDVPETNFGNMAEQPAPRVVDCHATGVCVQSGLWAEQPAQQSCYCLNCEELSKQVTALKLCVEVERGFNAQEQPAQRTWVGLTHEEHMEIMTSTMTTSSRMAAVEAKLKEKNT